MPRYTLNARTFVNGSLSEAGDIVNYEGWPGSSMDPADAVAERVKAAYAAMRKKGKSEPRKPDLTKFADPTEKPAPATEKDESNA